MSESEQPAAAPAAPEEQVVVRREPVLNLPPVVIGLIVLCTVIHLVRLYTLTAQQDLFVLLYGAFIPIRYSGQFALDVYAFTTPVTYSLLHGSLTHLAINMVWLAAFGSPLANRLGWPRFLLFWIAASVAAVALHYVLHRFDQSPLVGASGAISGMMGAAARFGFRVDRTGLRPAFAGPPMPVLVCLRMRPVITFLAVWMVVNLVTGLFGLGLSGDASGQEGNLSIAWEAHVGGFLLGFLGIGWFIDGKPRQRLRRRPMRQRNDSVD